MPAPNKQNRQFIAENWQKMSNGEIAKVLGLKTDNVRNYMNRMGLKRAEPKRKYTEAERLEARRKSQQEYRRKLAEKGIKPKQYYKPVGEKPKRKSPAKSHLVSNNAPIEKVAKLSTSENPAKFKINNPYRPNDPNVRYEPRIDPNNGRIMYIEKRVQG